MLDGLPVGALANGVGVVALLVLLFWMLATGRIVTRREHEGRIADKDEQIDTWRAAAKVTAEQAQKLTVIGEAQVRILDSIRDLAARQDAP